MFKNFLSRQQQPVRLIIRFLHLLDVKISPSVVKETLQQHAGYPSLLSFSDALTTWRIDNVMVRIAKENLDQLPLPFLAHLLLPEDALVLVTGVGTSQVWFLFDEKKRVQPLAEFLTKWSGIALLAEKTEESGEAVLTNNREAEWISRWRIPVLFVSLSLLVVVSASSFRQVAALPKFLTYTSLVLLQILGIAATSLLVWHSIDKDNPVLQKICSASVNTNCNSVLTSRYAKVFSWLSWSDVGLIYFVTAFLALIVAGLIQSVPLVSLVAWLSVAAFPIVLLSVYFQWRVIRQWCLLCLCTQVILLLQLSVSFAGGVFGIVQLSLLTVSDGVILLALGGFTSCGLLTASPLLIRSWQAKQLQKDLFTLKFNPQVWQSLLQVEQQVTVTTHGLGITLGNPAATNTLVKVCNTYCEPCAKVHSEIEKLLEENNNLKMQIIFKVTNDVSSTKTPIVQHLLAIAEKGDEKLTQKVLNDWYLSDSKDYDLFKTLYPISIDLQRQDLKIEAMDKWCIEMEIKYTPTVFINGYQLPEIYTIPDLKHLLI